MSNPNQLALATTLFVVGMHCTVTLSADMRPNVIVIFADDQGYHDLRCYGSQTIRTPHLDQMANEGFRLTSSYAQPVCGAWTGTCIDSWESG